MTPPGTGWAARGALLLRVAAGLAVLLAFLQLGTLVARFGRLPVPGSVAGMVLLAVSLRLRLLPPALVRPAADLLLRHMALLFVPPGVGLLLYLDLLRAQWLPILAAALAGTLSVLVVVGRVQQRLEGRG